MKTWTKSLVAGLLTGVVILGSLPALADPYGLNLGRRQMNQERRVQQGVQSGQMTPGEFRAPGNSSRRTSAPPKPECGPTVA